MTPDKLLAEANSAQEKLAKAILDARFVPYGATWAQAGSALHVRKLLAEAALAAGALTEDEAAQYVGLPQQNS